MQQSRWSWRQARHGNLYAVGFPHPYRSTKQDDNGIVPTGFTSYLLITRCPGVPLGDGDYLQKPKSEQDEIFEAFAEALEWVPLFRCKSKWYTNQLAHRDTKRCGVVSYGPKPEDLIWDAANKKW